MVGNETCARPQSSVTYNPLNVCVRTKFLFFFAWMMAASFYFYEIMLLISPSFMTHEIERDFNANSTQIGHLGAFYFYAYAGMQIPVGLLMDRYGPRILLTLASLFCALGCMIIGTADVIGMAYLGRLVMGFGGAFAVVGCLKLASLLFPTNRFALFTGIMVTMGMSGAMTAIYFGHDMIELLGWRTTMYWGAIVGLMLSGLIWFSLQQANDYFIPNRPKNFLDFWNNLNSVITNRQVWLLSLYAGLMYIPTTAFGELWGIRYLSDRFDITGKEAGLIMIAIFIGWAIGGPIFGWFSDHICRRKSPMLLAVLLTLGAMLGLMYLPVHHTGMWILLFLLGASSSGFILAFSVVREVNAPLLTGTAIGFINMLNNSSGFIQPVIGWLLDIQSPEVGSTGERIFSLTQFNNALLVIPACLFLALLIIPPIRETYCKPIDLGE
jgi:MFS family permease